MPTPPELLATYEHLRLHEANEAETRLKVIDQVLFQVLGWTHTDVSVEERVSEDGTTTFADYILRTGMTAIVIEAKKVGVTFDDVPNLRRAQLKGKWLSGETGKAITQARDYARKLGVPFSVVTNGNRWIIFPASRTDQVQFSESSAIIFPSLKSILQDDYAEFVDLLSRLSVIRGSLENELLGRIENQLEERRLNRFFQNGFSRASRHSLFPLMEDAITTAFTEDIVAADPALLEKCYVTTPERTRFDSRIMMHIGRRQSVITRRPLRPMRNDGNALGQLIESAARRSRPITILILGSVGAGKTTFLDHTRFVAGKDVFRTDSSRPYPHWIKVDFRDFSMNDDPMPFMIATMKDHISQDDYLSSYERCIKHAYKEEIDALLRGPLSLLADDEAEKKRRITDVLMTDYEQTQPYVEKVLRYVGRNAPVFLVVDNVDQFEDPKIQAGIFAEAMALAHRLGLNLICSVREATYVQHRDAPIFDAFDFDPIHIDPPKVDAVLSRRFFVARQLLEGKSGTFTAENGADFKISNLSMLIDLIQPSVLGTEIGNLIDVLATSDIRLALRMTREFLQSGYTASGRALQTYQSTGSYVMPPHEAMRAIMLGNRPVYFEEYSVIGNPFDARLSRTEAQLLRLYVLSALVNLSSQRSFQSLSGDEVRRVFRDIGFSDETALSVLQALCRLRFAHTSSHSPATLEASYLPSRLGGYIVRQLIGNLTFIENVMMDTFIAEGEIWSLLWRQTNDIYAQRDITRRLAVRTTRARCFFDYMKASYTPLRDESVRRGLPKEWCSHPLEAIDSQFSEGLERATRSAERYYGRGNGDIS